MTIEFSPHGKDRWTSLTLPLDPDTPFSVIPLLSLQRGQLEIVEMHLPATSPVLKRPLRDLALPPDSVLISIIRGDRIIVPKGDTTFQANDTVLALTVTTRVEELRQVFY